MHKDLKEISKLYHDGVNIIKHLKNLSNSDMNSSEMIKISYDFQAGSYIKFALANPEWDNKFCGAFSKVLNQLGEYNSILEAGVGEATTLRNIVSRLINVPSNIFGFDISFSRIKYAMKYLKISKVKNSILFLSNMLNASIQDNSIDVVYTSHAMEPNGGKEKEVLSELYRITRKYLVLFEPIYELANDKAKKYMEEHGYVRNLYSTATELGYKVIEYKIIFEVNPYTLNNTGVIIIEKNSSSKAKVFNPLACPITRAPLELIRNNYYCRESLLLYPIVDHIPCLLPENAIIATKYLDNI
jgi:uncharacterized protein YbaR (Trm112 family)/ubiquinone/menaquinone biosynthesis C-methylase UbiE